MIDLAKLQKFLRKILSSNQKELEKYLPNILSTVDLVNRELYDYRLIKFKQLNQLGYQVEISNILNKAQAINNGIQELSVALDELKQSTDNFYEERKNYKEKSVLEKRQHNKEATLNGLKELYNQGFNDNEIALRIGVSSFTVGTYRRKLGLDIVAGVTSKAPVIMDGVKEVVKNELQSFIKQAGKNSQRSVVRIPAAITKKLELTDNTFLVVAIKKASKLEIEEYHQN